MQLANEEIVKRPLVSEKSTYLAHVRNAYSFEVDRKADKEQIKKAIEELYNVKVQDVRTSVVPGKARRTKSGYATTPEWKKAVVVLHEHNKIDLF